MLGRTGLSAAPSRRSPHKNVRLNRCATKRKKLFLQEGGSCLDELRPAGSDDGSVTGVGDDPEAGIWNGFKHFDGELDGIERVAVALNDEGVGLDCGEEGRSEV